MREPKNQMLGTMEPPLMQLSVKEAIFLIFGQITFHVTAPLYLKVELP